MVMSLWPRFLAHPVDDADSVCVIKVTWQWAAL